MSDCPVCDWYTPEVEERIDKAGEIFRNDMERIRQGKGYIAPPLAPCLDLTGARWDPLLNGTK